MTSETMVERVERICASNEEFMKWWNEWTMRRTYQLSPLRHIACALGGKQMDERGFCAICHEPDKLWTSPFSGLDLCGPCFDAEQLEAWGGVTPANPYKGIHIVEE